MTIGQAKANLLAAVFLHAEALARGQKKEAAQALVDVVNRMGDLDQASQAHGIAMAVEAAGRLLAATSQGVAGGCHA